MVYHQVAARPSNFFLKTFSIDHQGGRHVIVGHRKFSVKTAVRHRGCWSSKIQRQDSSKEPWLLVIKSSASRQQ
jgi:hypothetical protein